MRGGANVSPDTRQRVIEAANDLSYVTVLQALNGDSMTRRAVAVIVPFVTRWFFSTVTAGAVDYLRGYGYDVLLYHLGDADVRATSSPACRRQAGWTGSSRYRCR